MLNAILLTLSLASAADLSAYRLESAKDSATARDIENAAADRVQRLRASLGTAGLRFAPPVTPKNGNRHELSSSSFFKEILAKGAAELNKAENYEKPPTFDPSSFINEIDAQAAQRRLQVCKRALGKELEQLVDEFRGQMILAKRRQAVSASSDAATAKAIGADLEAYISRNEPRASGQASIEEAIGRIYQIQAVDGIVTKLRLTKRSGVKLGDEAQLADQESLSLTLSMLAGFRSGRDRYFLDIQDCFLKHLETELASSRAAKAALEDTWVEKRREAGKKKLVALASRIAVLSEVQADAERKFKGAVFANDTLAKLSMPQLHFLIDLFLQLRGKDIPVAREITAFSMYVSVAEKRAADEASKTLLDGDFVFYKALHEDLYNLEDHLTEERKAEAQHKAVMNEIRAGGNK